MNKITTILICILSIFTMPLAIADVNNDSFLSDSQLKIVADELLQQIERIDAISINVRDKTRSTKWSHYKKFISHKIQSAKNWSDFVYAIDDLHMGIINRHAYLALPKSIRENSVSRASWPKIELGYTWPQLSFFDLNSGETVMALDDKTIIESFDHFFNFYCRNAHKEGCLRAYVAQLKYGYEFSEDKSSITVKYENGQSKIYKKTNKLNQIPYKQLSCEDYYSPNDYLLEYAGDQACLYSQNDTYILKITRFGAWGTSADDIYCKKTTNKGMCQDINTIAKITYQLTKPNLVIDLQDNGGGTENTPWVAALSKSGFRDNLVQYRNIDEIKNEKIRAGIFYGIDSAESWYQNLYRESAVIKDKYLPIRGDFCRDNLCTGQLIPSNSKRILFKNLAIITNADCASSCDDLIWRAKKYSGAKSYGQPPSTDGAYASIMGYLVLSPKGEISTIITSGYSRIPDLGKSSHLLTFQIPVAKTVSITGQNLEGDIKVLDVPLPVNVENFSSIRIANLKRTIQEMRSIVVN